MAHITLSISQENGFEIGDGVGQLGNRCYAPDAHTSCQRGFAYLQSHVKQPAVHSSRNVTEQHKQCGIVRLVR